MVLRANGDSTRSLMRRMQVSKHYSFKLHRPSVDFARIAIQAAAKIILWYANATFVVRKWRDIQKDLSYK